MNRRLTILLVLIAFSAAKADDKDMRARMGGGITDIAVTPNGTVWLTDWGSIFHAESIDDDWHDARPLLTEGRPEFSILRFFNAKTGILLGRFRKPGVDVPDYVSDLKAGMAGIFEDFREQPGDSKASPYTAEGYYYRTQDGGRTWSRRTHGDSIWVTDAAVDESGHAWIVGERGQLRYSDDYGKTWRDLQISSDYGSLNESIHMLNTREGILTGKSNCIVTTMDNWETCSKIETPLDQKKHVKGYLLGDKTEKARLWGNYLIVEQGSRVFYTLRDTIDWQLLGPGLLTFEVDNKTDRLVGIDRDLRVVSFTNPGDWIYWHQETLEYPPDYVTLQDGVFYAAKQGIGWLYRISETEFSRRTPYSADHRIEKPRHIETGRKYHWATGSDELLISDDQGQTWYREHVFDFEIHTIHILDDERALLWDGKQNHLYSLATHTHAPYDGQKPLAQFLRSPITKLVITYDFLSTQGYSEHSVTYAKREPPTIVTDQDGLLHTHEYIVKIDPNYFTYRKKSTPYQNTISIKHLTGILEEFNNDPGRIPSMEEFGIDANDIERYLVMLKDDFEGDYPTFFVNSKEDINFFISVPTRSGTLDSATLRAMLLSKWPMFIAPTGTGQLSVKIHNENDETLTMSREGYHPRAWYIPWQCQYDGVQFNCYYLSLSQLIKNSMPEKFPEKQMFDNAWLIRNVAEYLYRVEHHY